MIAFIICAKVWVIFEPLLLGAYFVRQDGLFVRNVAIHLVTVFIVSWSVLVDVDMDFAGVSDADADGGQESQAYLRQKGRVSASKTFVWKDTSLIIVTFDCHYTPIDAHEYDYGQ